MRKIIISSLAVLLAVSCGSNENTVINGDIAGAGAGSGEVVLSKLDIDKINVVDTIRTSPDGRFSYKATLKEGAPEFYYLSYNRKKLVSLLLKAGDKVSVKTDTSGKDAQIEGSDESVLLGQIENEMARSAASFDSLSAELARATTAKDQQAVERLKYELGAVYVRQKRAAIAAVMRNPHSFSNINVLYQQFNEALPVFGDIKDVIYFQRAYDSLQPVYPASPYIGILKGEIDRRSNLLELNAKVAELEEKAFPDLSLPDTQSRSRSLSELTGRPFILIFWSAADLAQKAFNQELKQLYETFHPKGLEIYSVSVDVDKTAWATAVREQELPWINVCDGLGENSPAVGTYNIKKVPALFIFDKEGDIVDKDIFELKRLNEILRSL